MIAAARMLPQLRLLVLAVAGLLASAGCEQERRVPYVPPTLHNWEQPYRGKPELNLHVFHVGTLGPPSATLLAPPMARRSPKRPLLAYVLAHPKEGLVVLDTGLNHRVAKKGNDYLGPVLRMTTSVELAEGQDLPSQMRAAGLDPGAVRRVILSNLRLTHAGEVEAFPDAQVSVTRVEHDTAHTAPFGYIDTEFDDVSEWHLVDFDDAEPLGTMPGALDLFGDGSLMLLEARGPTEGNVAMLIRLPSRPILLAGDLAPRPANLRHAVVPPGLRDRDAWWDHIWRLKRFQYLDPQLLVMPGNHPDAFDDAAAGEVHRHEFAPTEHDATPQP